MYVHGTYMFMNVRVGRGAGVRGARGAEKMRPLRGRGAQPKRRGRTSCKIFFFRVIDGLEPEFPQTISNEMTTRPTTLLTDHS